MPLVPIWNIFCLLEQRDLLKGQRVRFLCMGGKRKLVHEQKKKFEKFSKGRLSGEKVGALRLNFLGGEPVLVIVCRGLPSD